MAQLYQHGIIGREDDHRVFFKIPPIALDEVRGWIKEGAKENAIGIGAVVDAQGIAIGEMVMPSGQEAYMVGRDGAVRPVPKDCRVAFAQVGYMEPQKPIHLSVDSYEQLTQRLQELVPGEDRFMIRMTGEIADIEFRGVDGHAAAVKTFPEFLAKCASFFHYQKPDTYKLVGVFSKKGAVEKGVTFDDLLHLHGVDTATHTKGGHVRTFGKATLDVEVMPIGQWLVATHEVAEASATSSQKWNWRDRIVQAAHRVQENFSALGV